jgi:hypothetical protein
MVPGFWEGSSPRYVKNVNSGYATGSNPTVVDGGEEKPAAQVHETPAVQTYQIRLSSLPYLALSDRLRQYVAPTPSRRDDPFDRLIEHIPRSASSKQDPERLQILLERVPPCALPFHFRLLSVLCLSGFYHSLPRYTWMSAPSPLTKTLASWYFINHCSGY